jgi:hypothetical protein
LANDAINLGIREYLKMLLHLRAGKDIEMASYTEATDANEIESFMSTLVYHGN